jgi:hypothetical protein
MASLCFYPASDEGLTLRHTDGFGAESMEDTLFQSKNEIKDDGWYRKYVDGMFSICSPG